MRPLVIDDSPSNYYKANWPDQFAQLLALTQASPKYYCARLNHSQHLLRDWVVEVTPELRDPVYELKTKVHWILMGIKSFEDPRARCKSCNEPMENYNVRSLKDGYHDCCSCSCAMLMEEKQEKIRQTTFKNFGVTSVLPGSFKAKYGVNSPMLIPEFKQRNIDSIAEKHGGRGFGSPDINAKIKKTTLDLYGNEIFAKTDLFRELFIATCQENWGADNPMQTEAGYQLFLNSVREKYDDDTIMSPVDIPGVAEKISNTKQSFSEEKRAEIKAKTEQTCLENFGYKNAFSNPEIRKKAQETLFKKTGYYHPSQNPETIKKSRKRYVFEGETYDSAPEIIFKTWCNEHDIKVVHSPDNAFPYDANGKTYYYHPDFLIIESGQLVDVKGAHFFEDYDSNKKMRCPYRKKSWSDERYKQECDKYEAKHQCMLANSVKIIVDTSDEMLEMMKFVTEKFGRDYVSQFNVEKKGKREDEKRN